MANLHVEYKLRGDSSVMAATDAKVEGIVGTDADDTGVFTKPDVDERGAYNLRELNFPGMDQDAATDLLPKVLEVLGQDTVLVQVEEDE